MAASHPEREGGCARCISQGSPGKLKQQGLWKQTQRVCKCTHLDKSYIKELAHEMTGLCFRVSIASPKHCDQKVEEERVY